MDIAWAIAGHGPRRWQALGSRGVAANEALVLPKRAIQRTRQCEIDRQRPRASVLRMLRQLDRDLQRGWAVAGWLGYETGAALEGLVNAAPQSLPDAAWLCFDPRDVEVMPLLPGHPRPPAIAVPASLASQREAFVASALDIAARIAAGEVYQVNLTAEMQVSWQGLPDPHAAVSAALACQPVPLSMGLRLPGVGLLCGSMERFLSVRGGHVRSRPIKGTAPRGDDEATDRASAAQLQASPKERAENTMIVDMVRNDLQRACLPASVEVPHLLQAEPYTTLWHLESEVSGTLAVSDRLAPLLAATLPPASVTGCPKVQAMQVIAARERRRRGPYCGAVGVAWPDGTSDWAVAIRTAWFDGREAHVAVGAGLVAGAQPEAEWQETCLKAQATLRTLATLGGGVA